MNTPTKTQARTLRLELDCTPSEWVQAWAHPIEGTPEECADLVQRVLNKGNADGAFLRWPERCPALSIYIRNPDETLREALGQCAAELDDPDTCFADLFEEQAARELVNLLLSTFSK